MNDILIHARDFRERTPAVRFGVRLAAAHSAAVTAVYAYPEPVYVAPAYGPEVLVSIRENADTHLRDALHAQETFCSWAASLGVARSRWLVAQGAATDALAQAAIRHDLLVLDRAKGELGSAWDLPGLIVRADVPCFVIPQDHGESVEFERVAIAWNGSPEAMRAVHAALPFMQGKPVLLLEGEERQMFSGVEWHPAFNICEYLRRRGVMAELREVDVKPDDAGAALLEEAARFGAGLLVMGAYGRSRFSEWMFGGATRDVLAWARIPVLLRH